MLTRNTGLAWLALLSTPFLGTAASAQTDIGTANATANQLPVPNDQGPFAPPAPGSAADIAPSHAPLEAAQPTSIVNRSFLEDTVALAQNYDDDIKFTPSAMNIQPAGPVSQQNYGESIRGFQYGQFNTTFDGLVLPGLPTNFAPESSTYFTNHDLGSIVVDRGPGTASTIGYATFGGTLALLSKEPAENFQAEAYTTFGSFHEELGGIEVDSGAQPALGGGRGLLDVSRLDTQAYITGVTTTRDNVFGKWEQPLGDNTLITLVGMVNDSYGHTAYGSTLAQITARGPDYGLNTNPHSQAFYGWNSDDYNTDFEYVRIASNLGDGWSLEETPYTASYFRHGTEGADPNGTTANLTSAYFNGIKLKLDDDLPGVTKHNDFRDWGSTTKIVKTTPWGELRMGVWVDYLTNGVYRYKIDFDRNDAVYTTKATAAQYNQQYHNRLVTAQPYIEFAWKPLPGLIITPGVKYTSVTRELDVGVLSTTTSGETNQTWNKAQPSVEAHYDINTHWSAYFQAAVGFLAPPLSTLETPLQSTVTPQETVNYQVGTAYEDDRLALDGDLYYIPFQNFIASRSVDGNTQYFNEGGALYKGVELEGTYKIGGGASLYANGTLNDANYDNGAHIYQAPQRTAVIGALFNRGSVMLDHDKLTGSILLKDFGKQFGLNSTSAAGPTALYPIKSYSNIDLAVGYTLPLAGGRKARFGLNFYNILDNHSLIAFAGSTAAGTPLYWTDPGFSGFFTVAITM